MTATTTTQVTVRFFAAARAAAGNEVETIRLRPGTTVAGLVDSSASATQISQKC